MLRIALSLAALAALALAPSAAAAPLPLVPNDPGWSGQWGLRQIGIPQVWRLARPGVHPVVATVDTGVNAAFPDLRGAVARGWNLVQGNADTSDAAGHGTDVATVIAANANNGFGIAGACPVCRVMPVKISLNGEASPKIIAAGIRWAVDHGARIVVVSLVHPAPVDPDEQPAIDYATSHGAVVIASAGNDGGTVPHYPAALAGVVAVAASDESDSLYPWATHGAWVELTAPGCEYGSEMCGASYAPPLVAGAIGLLTAVGPSVTPLQALEALRATAVPVEGVTRGRIDVLAAARALGLLSAGPTVAPSTTQVELERGVFGRTLHRSVGVSGGPLTVVLTRANARSCDMTLRTGTAVYRGRRSTPTTLDLRARVGRGTYALTVSCRGSRPHPYALLLTGPLMS